MLVLSRNEDTTATTGGAEEAHESAVSPRRQDEWPHDGPEAAATRAPGWVTHPRTAERAARDRPRGNVAGDLAPDLSDARPGRGAECARGGGDPSCPTFRAKGPRAEPW